jgi:hypothetical protein
VAEEEKNNEHKHHGSSYCKQKMKTNQSEGQNEANHTFKSTDFMHKQMPHKEVIAKLRKLYD